MKKQTFFKIIWVVLLVVEFIMLIYPISTGFIRLGIVLGFILLLSSGFYLFWKVTYLRLCFFLISIIVLFVIIIPGHNANSKQLQNEYVHSLLKYENVRYIWGGENKIGIDCSGLVR